MSKLICMRGLPASGKTTKAKELQKEYGNFVRVNKDDLRQMMLEGNWNYKKEKQIITAQIGIVDNLLKHNINVIIDDTNLNPKHIERWKNMAEQHSAKFEIVDMNISLDQCVKRNSLRDNSVDIQVIISMALKYGLWKPEKKIIICDIDGTVADITHRLHYVKDGNKDWDGFFSAIPRDKPRQDVWEMVVKDAEENDCFIFFVSGRNGKYKQITLEWLSQYGMSDFTALFMREEHDYRPDNEVKQDFLNLFGKENIIRVYDDRPRVITMWRENGLDVVDVGNGIEF